MVIFFPFLLLCGVGAVLIRIHELKLVGLRKPTITCTTTITHNYMRNYMHNYGGLISRPLSFTTILCYDRRQHY